MQLTKDQEAAKTAIFNFLSDSTKNRFVLSGYSGTGKSTLVKYIVDHYENVIAAARLIDPDVKPLDIVLTATTNKAVEALHDATGYSAQTIYSLLGLRVATDYVNNTTKLVPKKGNHVITDQFVLVDEASFADIDLIRWIDRICHHCKILYIGDPAQLIAVKAKNAPVFELGYPTAKLSEVVRQAGGNQIIDLATQFRETVTTGKFFSFTPDSQNVILLDRADFNQRILDDLGDPGWRFKDSKVLAWRNKCVQSYNHEISKHAKGNAQLQTGDYAICNSYISGSNGGSIKTDQLVQITDIHENITRHNVNGRMYQLDNRNWFFAPYDPAEKAALLTALRKNKAYQQVMDVEENWIDLRSAYACTIDKSQGSTYDRVYLDLDDIKYCRQGDRIARMMYVGVSRARHQVYLTGDLV